MGNKKAFYRIIESIYGIINLKIIIKTEYGYFFITF
jgi:hypothetical protein